MYFSKFIITNYKGIKKLEIDLEKEPISKVLTLVGLNESGKTSILEAIDLFQNDIAVNENHKLIPKEKKLNFNDSIKIEAHLKLNESDEKAIKSFALSFGFKEIDDIKQVIIVREKIFKNSVFQQEESGDIWELNISGLKKGKKAKWKKFEYKTEEWKGITDFIETNLIPKIIYYPNFLFDFPSKIFLEKYSSESEEQETYREVISDILDSINDGLNIEEHILERMKSKTEDASEALESTISKMSSKVSETVFQAWQTLFKAKGKEIVLKTGVELTTIPNKYYLEVRLKEGANHFQISERSLGFKWFFTFLLFTEFRKMRSTDQGEILFLLDEPASNLHSTAQKKLLGTFQNLVTKCKLIYTTHSHHLINPDWLSGAYIVRNRNLNYDDELNFVSEKTDIEAVPYKQFVATHPDQTTYFQPILDALDFQPGLLEAIPNIIVTEGKNDFYTFKYINDVIMDSKFSNLNFYPGAGKDKNNQVVGLYLAWNRDFKILLDGDKPGIEAKKKYIDVFGEIILNNIITLKDVDSEFNDSLEYLFEDKERIFISQIFDPTVTKYEKSKFNTGIQMLFLQKRKIELSKTTLNKFKKIFKACS